MKSKMTSISVVSTHLILAGLLCTQQLSAAPDLGVVDMKMLLLNSPELKVSMDILKARFEPRRQEMLKLSSEAKSNPNDENLQREFNRQAIEFQNSAYTARTEATNIVIRSIVETIRNCAMTEHLDVVGSDAPLLVDPPFGMFAAPADITEKVLAMILNPSTGPPTPAQKGKVRDYARRHDIAVVFDTVHYAKPHVTITDITADVQALLKLRSPDRHGGS
jgi:Skp family chaperone for outer membrane proteins